MQALDTSLLAYAVNRHAPEHARAARVVETLANGALPWALPWPVRKLPRQVDSSKLDSRTWFGLGRNVRGGSWPRLSWGRSLL